MEAILNGIRALVEFFSMTVTSVVQLVKMLPGLSAGIINSFAFAPDFLVPFLSLSVTISLIFAIVRLL